MPDGSLIRKMPLAEALTRSTRVIQELRRRKMRLYVSNYDALRDEFVAPSLRYFRKRGLGFKDLLREAKVQDFYSDEEQERIIREMREAALDAERSYRALQALDSTYRVEVFDVERPDGSIVRVTRERVSLR